MKQFALEFWKDEDWYVGRLIEVPGVIAVGHYWLDADQRPQRRHLT